MITAEEKAELDALALEINAAVDEGDAYTAQAVGVAGVAIRARIKAGKKLIRAKKLAGHGNYLEWLEANCPKLSESSAKRYVRLANRSKLIDLDTASGVCEAYTLAGLMPEREGGQGDEEDGKKKGDNYVVHISRALDVLNKAAVDGWQQQDKAQLRARLKPLVDLYDRLA